MKRVTLRGWVWLCATAACMAFYGWLALALPPIK
jgi:hypothetical protein